MLRMIHCVLFCSAQATGKGVSVEVTINSSALRGRVAPEYVSFNFEFGSGGAGGNISGDGLSKLEFLGKQLSPSYLRVGGNSADLTVYQLGRESACVPHNNSGPRGAPGVGDPEKCMSPDQLLATADFARAIGAKVVFDVNEYYGFGSPGENLGGGPRPQRIGPINLTNAEDLLDWWNQNPRAVPDKVTLGNELPNNLSPAVTAADFAKFSKLLSDKGATPELLGTDAWWKNQSWVRELLTQPELPPLGAFTFHLYLLGEDITAARVLDPDVLDSAATYAAGYNSELAQGGRTGLPLWITEAGAAWGGAIDQFGPAFIDGFWFLDQLGSLARQNVIVQHRHALAGSWGPCFIGEQPNFIPRPDFFTAVLWKRLVGTNVLSTAVHVNQPSMKSSEEVRLLRVYGHCHKTDPTKVTFIVVNLANYSWDVKFPVERDTLSVDMYWMTPSDSVVGLLDQQIALNGDTLQVSGDGPWSMPPMAPKQVELGAHGLITIPALGYGFLVMDSAIKLCT